MKQKLFLIFLIWLLLFCVDGCKKQAENTQDAQSSMEDPLEEGTDQKILTFSLSGYSEGGKRSWDLKGDSADILMTNVVLLNNVLGHNYTKDNTLTLTADEGEFDKNNSMLLLRKNVVATTIDGAKLTTDWLNWDATKEEVDTDAFVKIERENMEACGQGAFGQPDLNKMHFKKDVTVKLKPTTVVTSDGPLHVDTLNNSAVFNDNVVVVDERGKIWADKIEIYFNPETKTVEEVFAKGNVKILRGENLTYSNQASYNADLKRMVLSGRPRLVLHSQEGLNAFTGN